MGVARKRHGFAAGLEKAVSRDRSDSVTRDLMEGETIGWREMIRADVGVRRLPSASRTVECHYRGQRGERGEEEGWKGKEEEVGGELISGLISGRPRHSPHSASQWIQGHCYGS